jgi:hypothetical protein
MWKAFDGDGRLVYGSWVDTLPSLMPMYWVRAIGGTLYLSGAILFVSTSWKTINKGQRPFEEKASAPALAPLAAGAEHGGFKHRMLEGKPLQFTVWTTVAIAHRRRRRDHPDHRHRVQRPDHRLGQALHAARARGPRRLHQPRAATSATRR